jgi:hypothetical protein
MTNGIGVMTSPEHPIEVLMQPGTLNPIRTS